MSFPAIAARVLCAKGHAITAREIQGMDPRLICRMTGLPSPCFGRKPKKSHRKVRELQVIPPATTRSSNDIFFEGYDRAEGTETCHLHVDGRGLRHSLKCMDHPDEIIIPKNMIRVKYEFEFDNGPYIRVMRNADKKGFTRKDVAIGLAKQYQRFFNNRAKYEVWVRDISCLGINAISYNSSEKVYELCVDLTH